MSNQNAISRVGGVCSEYFGCESQATEGLSKEAEDSRDIKWFLCDCLRADALEVGLNVEGNFWQVTRR